MVSIKYINTIANYIKAEPGGFICSKTPLRISVARIFPLFIMFQSIKKAKETPFAVYVARMRL